MRPDSDPIWFDHSCCGKEKHPSEAAALALVAYGRRRKEENGGRFRNGDRLEAYECVFFEPGEDQHWHIGHKGERK